MRKITTQWQLFTYKGTQCIPLSKLFKTREEAESARLKYSERERKSIAIGVVRRAA
jgi:hypothetical protein